MVVVVVVETRTVVLVGAGASTEFAVARVVSVPLPDDPAVASGDAATVVSAGGSRSAPDGAGSVVSELQPVPTAHNTTSRPTVASRRRAGGMVIEPPSLDDRFLAGSWRSVVGVTSVVPVS